MNVLADPTGPPFRKSDAVVQASAFTVTGCCTSDNAFVTQVVRLR
jgi:hypothetical protein